MSLKAAKIPNESNPNQKPNCQERGVPQVGKSPQRKSRKVPFFDHADVKHSTRTERDPYVDQNPHKVAC